jgi:ribonuclease HI
MRRLFSTLRIYTDGSCIGNRLKGGTRGGIGIYFPNGEYKNISMSYPKSLELPATSQRCELLAVSHAMVIHTLLFRNKQCIIYTDSEYTIKSLTQYSKLWTTNGWRKTNGELVKNTDLLIPMLTIFKNSPNIGFQHVRAHTGLLDEHSLNNNIADAFARKGLGYK